jgi:hypothetical protein
VGKSYMAHEEYDPLIKDYIKTIVNLPPYQKIMKSRLWTYKIKTTIDGTFNQRYKVHLVVIIIFKNMN